MKKLLLLVFLLNCVEEQKPELITLPVTVTQKDPPKPTTSISSTHSRLFHLEETEYRGSLIYRYLELLTYDMCTENQKLLETNWIVYKLMTGCTNFYLMNDIGAAHSFEKLKQLTEGKTKDCYTVGFSQFYLMTVLSECNNISVS